MTTNEGFAGRLRWWRERRGLSQLDLAGNAGISQRHLSFLELGRAAPSREMVLVLAGALAIPFREQNALLLAAGFAPLWRERPLDTPESATLNRALGLMLTQQEPFPAFVLDRRWNLLRANNGGRRLLQFLTGSPDLEIDPAQPVNLADALLSPDGLRPLVTNWPDAAVYFIRTVRSDVVVDGTRETAALLERLLSYPDVRDLAALAPIEASQEPVLTIELQKNDVMLRLFTALAMLGNPLEVAADEVRLEAFFPADEATALLLRQWAK